MRKRLIVVNGKSEWVEHQEFVVGPQRKMNTQGEDLTVDGYIGKHGGIESSIDGKIYTSKGAYMDHVKSNGCEIKDY